MKKYDKIKYKTDVPDIVDKSVQTTIKYDGSNGRITRENGKIVVGTRSVEASDIKDLPHGLGEKFSDIVSATYQNFEQTFPILDKYVIFFEVCGSRNLHKIKYPWDLKYVVFDAWDKGSHKYVPHTDPDIQKFISITGIDQAEILPIYSYSDAYEWISNQDGTKVEGVVVKDYETGDRCKILHEKNKELESAIFVKSKGSDNLFESKVLHVAITRNRVEKLYYKVKDLGYTGMEGFGPFLKLLIEDIIEEVLPSMILKEKPKNVDISYIKRHAPAISRIFFDDLIQ